MNKNRFYELIKNCYVPYDLQGKLIIAIIHNKEYIFIFKEENTMNAFLQRSHRLMGGMYTIDNPEAFRHEMIQKLEKYYKVKLALITKCNIKDLEFLPIDNLLEME